MIRSINMFGFFFTVAFFLASCGNQRNSESGKDEHAGHDTSGQSVANTSNLPVKDTDLKDEYVNAIYEHYVNLTNALIKGDVAQARISSNAIEAGAKDIPGANAIATSAARITSANNIDVQRAEYSKLSDKLIDLARKSGMKSGKLYVDYCPMALNDKGAYWLSSIKEIKNPYFGDVMLKCGEVKETIK